MEALTTLEYGVTRTFKWPWFGTISLIGAALLVPLLTAINIPLTGYETVSTLQSDFRATDPHWYDRFTPFRKPESGSLCDPHIFKVGDAFTTNYTLFEWTVNAVTKANVGDSAISYKGIPLTFCDVASVYADGDFLNSWSIVFTVIVKCEQDNMFAMEAKTIFSISRLAGRYSPILGTVGLLNGGTSDTRGNVLYDIIRAAYLDLWLRVFYSYQYSSHTTATMISLRADFDFCPMSLGKDAPCSISKPNFHLMDVTAVYGIGNISAPSVTDLYGIGLILDDNTELPFYNLLQTVYAAIRVDMGNPSENNFIVNPLTLNATIYEDFLDTAYNNHTTSSLYDQSHNPNPNLHLPISVPGPAHIQVVYPCQFQQRKPLGPLIVSVLVATLSMFSSGWAFFIFTATALAKRTDPAANRCDGHCSLHGMTKEPSGFDSFESTGSSSHSPGLLPKNYVYTPVNN